MATTKGALTKLLPTGGSSQLKAEGGLTSPKPSKAASGMVKANGKSSVDKCSFNKSHASKSATAASATKGAQDQKIPRVRPVDHKEGTNERGTQDQRKPAHSLQKEQGWFKAN